MKKLGKITLSLGLFLFILGISMFLFAASLFTSTGEVSSFVIKLGECSMVFWLPSIIIGMILSGIGFFFTIKK